MIALLGLISWIIHEELERQSSSDGHQQYGSRRQDNLGPSDDQLLDTVSIWLIVYAYYMLTIHFLVTMFPIRASWAIFTLTRSLKQAADSKALRNFQFRDCRRSSSTSLSSTETLTASRELESSSTSEPCDPEYLLDALEANSMSDQVVHAIIVPSYKEEMDTLRETLEVLSSHPQACSSYDVSCYIPHSASTLTNLGFPRLSG